MNRTDLQEALVTPRGPRPGVRLPAHCRASGGSGEAVRALKRRLRAARVHTVCEEARCPNLTQCFSRGTATFMLLGETCTRTCRFCNVMTGAPGPVDPLEPGRIASVVVELGLRHVVLTSVNRDDLSDGGAAHFARTIHAIRADAPGVTVEVLTPDFQGAERAVETVLAAAPEVYNHNVETVPRLYASVRPGARFERSLELLQAVALSRRLGRGGPLVKSGLMVGLGERTDEVVDVLEHLRAVGVDCVTLGQYLRPTLRHLPVDRYLDPEEFDALAESARQLGFRHVASGPLVRSSFHADATLDALLRSRGDHAAL